MVKKNILFVCRYNRFRSRIAEAQFKKINKDKNIQVRSAGLFEGDYPLDKEEVRTAKKLGLELKGRPKAISVDLLHWQNLIVIVADNVPKEIFKSRKWKRNVLVWKIKDVDDNYGDAEIEKIIKQIIPRVNKLYKKLK